MIIFDSSTLILLARTDLLERFMRHVNQAIVIPISVARESCEEKKSMDAPAIQRAIQEKRITVMGLNAKKLSQKIAKDFGLGRGETEAIALASSKKAQLLATDDKRAILACRLLKIPYTTAIDILVRMSQKKILSKEETRLKLQALERYGRYKQGILLDAKSKLEVK